MKKEHRDLAMTLIEATKISLKILEELSATEKLVQQQQKAVAQTRLVNNRLLNAVRKEDVEKIKELSATYEKDIALAKQGKKYDYVQTHTKVGPRF